MVTRSNCRPPSTGLVSSGILIAGLIIYCLLPYVPGYVIHNNGNVAVPVHNIPAYHIIKADEFTSKVLDNRTLPSNAIHNISPYVNMTTYCTLEPLEANKPLSSDLLFDLHNLTGLEQATVVGVPATLATSLGGKLKRGDVTDLVVPSFGGKEPLEIGNVHVLDIIGNASDNASAEFTIVVVLPKKSALRLINETRGNRAVATRVLEV